VKEVRLRGGAVVRFKDTGEPPVRSSGLVEPLVVSLVCRRCGFEAWDELAMQEHVTAQHADGSA